MQESFGAAHVVSVLRGANTAAIRARGHDQLTTHGLLARHSQSEIRDFIQQLIGQEALVQSGGEYPILKLNAASWEIMKDQRAARLMKISSPEEAAPSESVDRSRTSRGAVASWEGVDRDLFERLRGLRLELASERGVPPYVVFSDATLRELARIRPSSLEAMHLVYGVGEAKLRDFGPVMLEAINAECEARQLSRDNPSTSIPSPAPREAAPRKPSGGAIVAAELFRKGASIEEAMQQLNRARSTTCEYLCDYIRIDKPDSIASWVAADTYRQVAEAVSRVGPNPLKPIFLALNESVPYDVIRLVVTHLETIEA